MKMLLFAFATLSLVGCKAFEFHPVGPLAKQRPPAPQQSPAAPDAQAAPSLAPPIQPTPPTLMVTPDEVTADNAHLVAAKFAAELEADSKGPVNGPVTVEVSHIQGGVREP